MDARFEAGFPAIGSEVQTKYPHVDLRPQLFSGTVIGVSPDDSYVLVRPHVGVRDAEPRLHFNYYQQIQMHTGRLEPMISGNRRIPSYAEIEKQHLDEFERLLLER